MLQCPHEINLPNLSILVRASGSGIMRMPTGDQARTVHLITNLRTARVWGYNRQKEMPMKTITIEIPDHVELPFTGSDEEIAREIRIGAAIQWYQQELILLGKAAEIAGLSRTGFLDALYRAKVPACQASLEDLKEELGSWQRLSGES